MVPSTGDRNGAWCISISRNRLAMSFRHGTPPRHIRSAVVKEKYSLLNTAERWSLSWSSGVPKLTIARASQLFPPGTSTSAAAPNGYRLWVWRLANRGNRPIHLASRIRPSAQRHITHLGESRWRTGAPSLAVPRAALKTPSPPPVAESHAPISRTARCYRRNALNHQIPSLMACDR